MIDYDELDERIRKIVREELRGTVSGSVVSSLLDADTTQVYRDRSGDVWSYRGDSWGWVSPESYTGVWHQVSYTRDGWDSEGPFQVVQQ